MKLLLDTHAFLWHADGSPQLSAAASIVLADSANDLYLSVASVWEIAIKVGLGKLTLSCGFAEYMSKAVEGYSISLVPITIDDCTEYSTLPFPSRDHRDPFDRLIIIHAKRHAATVVGSDTNFDLYGIPRLW